MIQRGKKKERILRVLLNEPEGKLSKYRISKEANCSFPWTHEYLKRLENFGFINGTKVLNYLELVKTWFNVRKKPLNKEYLIKKPLALLGNINLKYALTTYQAENLVQNSLFPSRTDVYVKKVDINAWHKLLSENGLTGKGNFRLLIDDEHVFYGSFKKDNKNLVSIPQLIVDLYLEGGVCVEAAEKLLEKLVNFYVSS